MHYTGQTYRPPTEAYTPLLEITAGCSYNRCAFCTMYRETKFQMSPEESIIADLKELRAIDYKTERLFLLNGDPFILPPDKLLRVAQLVHNYLPKVETMCCYCSIRDLKYKSLEDLKKLRRAGFNDLYIGLETAYAPALSMMNKGFTVSEEYEVLQRIKSAGFDYMALLMNGVAGKGHSKESVAATAKLLNEIPPKMVALLATAVSPGTPLEKLRDEGKYIELSEREMIEEEKLLLRSLNMPDSCFFFASHVFDLIRVSDFFKNKQKIIDFLDTEMKKLPLEVLDNTWERGSI